jgi:tetraacyldisaccharide 4'-kinase
VITLAEGLRSKGFKPVILSRGYKRHSGGIVVAGRSWEESGDEPHLMARRLQDIPVIVCADRYAAGSFAEARQLGNIFILDDGFQHRKLHRDMDIVMVDPAEWAGGERLLPAGRWREPKTAIERAHAACIQETPGVEMPAVPIPSFTVRTHVDGLYRNGIPVRVETLTGRKVVAIAGIAKPERFFSTLESLGITAEKRFRFRDHHVFTKQEIEKLSADVLITTEKDAVRLDGLAAGDFLALRISAKIPDFDRLWEIVLQRTESRI